MSWTGEDLFKSVLLGGASSGGSGSTGGGSGGGGDEASLLDVFLDGSATEISSKTVEKIRGYAIYKHEKLQKVDFPNVTEIETGGISYCYVLAEINTPKLVKCGSSAFVYNTAMQRISYSLLTTAGKSAFSCLQQCREVNLPALESVSANCFDSDYVLEKADFSMVESVNSNAFKNCSSLIALILRNEAMVTLAATTAFANCAHILGTVNSAYNPDGLKDGYIYVPSALVDTYKAATNWATFADQFRALEDYTVDGTTTGELDESKI